MLPDSYPEAQIGWTMGRLCYSGIILCVFLLLTTAEDRALAQEKGPPESNSPPSKQVNEADENRQKEAEEAKRLTELYLRNQSVFLRKGELMVELDSFYIRNSRQELQRTNGSTDLLTTTRRFFDNSIIARYGILTDGLEIDLFVPAFIHAEVESDSSVGRTEQKETRVGDISAALRYQIWYERGARPSVVLDIEGKSRIGGTGLTGTGNWNAGGGVTLIKTLDPVVFFGRLGYTYNFASQTRDLGNIFDYRVGMGFSLNDRVSFNVQLTGALIGPTTVTTVDTTGGTGTIGGITPVVFSTRRTEIMNIVFTTTVMVTKKLFIEPLVAVALTEESFTIVGVRIPYRF
jgi:hypothetical protein